MGKRDAPVCGESIGGGLGREDGGKWEKPSSSSSSSLSMGSFPRGGSMQPHCNRASVPFLINERKKKKLIIELNFSLLQLNTR